MCLANVLSCHSSTYSSLNKDHFIVILCTEEAQDILNKTALLGILTSLQNKDEVADIDILREIVNLNHRFVEIKFEAIIEIHYSGSVSFI